MGSHLVPPSVCVPGHYSCGAGRHTTFVRTASVRDSRAWQNRFTGPILISPFWQPWETQLRCVSDRACSCGVIWYFLQPKKDASVFVESSNSKDSDCWLIVKSLYSIGLAMHSVSICYAIALCEVIYLRTSNQLTVTSKWDFYRSFDLSEIKGCKWMCKLKDLKHSGLVWSPLKRYLARLTCNIIDRLVSSFLFSFNVNIFANVACLKNYICIMQTEFYRTYLSLNWGALTTK